jgi:hypothetical protein
MLTDLTAVSFSSMKLRNNRHLNLSFPRMLAAKNVEVQLPFHQCVQEVEAKSHVFVAVGVREFSTERVRWYHRGVTLNISGLLRSFVIHGSVLHVAETNEQLA